MQAASGERDAEYDDGPARTSRTRSLQARRTPPATHPRSGRRRAARRTAQAARTSARRRRTRRSSTRGACSSYSSGTSPGTRPRWWSGPAGYRGRPSGRSASDHGEFRAGPDHRVGVQRRLDAAHRRRAVHPRRVDPPGAARQHRPAGRRHPGAARARLHSGLHRHPDAVRPAARATSRCRTRTPTRTWTASSPRRAPTGGSGRTCAPTRLACSRPTGAPPRPRRTTTASTTCRG